MDKSKGNSLKLLVIAFSLTFITGIAVTLPFIIKRAASQQFHATLAEAGFVFGFFMVGMVCTQFLNGFFIEKVSVKTELYIMSIVYVILIIWMYNMHSFIELLPILFIMGFIFGIVVTIPNFLIVHSFKGTKRSSNLNRLDMFFSIGSFLWPFLAGVIIAALLPWQTVYLSVIVVWIFIVIMITISKLPDVSSKHLDSAKEAFSKWNKAVWLTGVAMFFYFVSYVGFTYWVASYLQKYLHISAAAANTGYSLFWIFYLIGCFISSIAVTKIKVNNYIIGSMIVAAISYIVIIKSPNSTVMLIAISVLGLGCATVYSSTLAFGSLLVEKPSPKLIGFFITLSGIGTLVGEYYSSYVVGAFGMLTVVWLSALFMLIGIIIYFMVSANQKDNPRLKIGKLEHKG